MQLLSLETSGLSGSVALWQDGKVTERPLATEGRRHAQTLIAELKALLDERGVKLADIDGIAVSIGPGSFTGLRVGVVAAKTLAYAIGCGVLAVDTIASFAEAAPVDWSRVHVISDAQRGDLFHGEYQRDAARHFELMAPIRIIAGEDFRAGLNVSDIVLGPSAKRWTSEASGPQFIHEPWLLQPSATNIVNLAARKWTANERSDLWTLAPFYLRPSAAEEKRMAQKES
jgi:tRNA threonylcarbamoyladenosine biosynthesis protein TsaB